MEHQEFSNYCKDCHGPCDFAAGDMTWKPVDKTTRWVFRGIFAAGAVAIIAFAVTLLVWGIRP